MLHSSTHPIHLESYPKFLIFCTFYMIILLADIYFYESDLKFKESFKMKKLTRQEKHEQCMREIRGTLIVVLICCVWHIASAFLLNGSGLYFLGMPAWFSVSTLGTIVLSLIGVWYLLRHVFINFEYDDEEEVEE